MVEIIYYGVFHDFQFSSVQLLSCVRLFATPWITARQASLSITNSNSRPSSWWCHPAISSSVVPFSSCPQSLPASESFPMSQLFTWGGQSTGVSALVSFLPKKSQGWSPSEWTGYKETAYNAGDLGRDYPLGKRVATHCSILAWRIPWIEEPRMLQSMGLQRVRHDWGTNTFNTHSFCERSVIVSLPPLWKWN